MRAPQQARTRDQIVDATLAVIAPPADQLEAIRAKVVEHIGALQRFAEADIPHGEFKKRLAEYLRNLRASKRTFVHLPYFWDYSWPKHKQFLTQLDAEIERIQREHDQIKVTKGSKRRDPIADLSVQYAMALLARELPPTRWCFSERLTWKAWHQVTALLYEAVTGKPDSEHLLKYVREYKRDLKKVKERSLTPPTV